jgi:hypothetical protein
MVGAMAHTMWGPPGQEPASAVVRKMVAFLGAGFRAEVSQ